MFSSSFVPVAHVLLYLTKKDVDGRDKPGHDEQTPRQAYAAACSLASRWISALLIAA